jgi:hypothetical protein
MPLTLPSPRWGEGEGNYFLSIRSARLRLRLALLDGYGLGEVSRLVDVAAEADRHVVSQELQGDR